jgi:hypothetical protein
MRADVQAPELTDIVAGANPDVIFRGSGATKSIQG